MLQVADPLLLIHPADWLMQRLRGSCDVQRQPFCTTTVIATQYLGGGGIGTEVGQGRSEAAAATLCFVLPAFQKLWFTLLSTGSWMHTAWEGRVEMCAEKSTSLLD